VVGGYFADKYLGIKQSIYWGASLFIIGYLLMSLPQQRAFYLGLSFLCIGNGFFKPNIMNILGQLYSGPEDHRRNSGFTLFYMSINMGALLPPLFLGPLVKAFNWEAGFMLALFGMIFSFVIVFLGRMQLKRYGNIPLGSQYRTKGKRKNFLWLFGGGLVVCIALLDLLLRFARQVDYLVIGISIIFLGVVFYYLSQEPKIKRMRMTAALILTLISGGFWMFYAQGSSLLVLFAKRSMEMRVFGLPLNPEIILFFTPFFIIILCPFLSKLWLYLAHRAKDPSTPVKFALGIFLMAAAYFVLALSVSLFRGSSTVSVGWIGLSYLFQAVGELLISPVGLAMITVLSPKEHLGLMMGIWFLIQAAAFALSGELGSVAAITSDMSNQQVALVYSKAFFFYACLCFALALVALFCIPLLKKLMRSTN
jgi:POT family proton-dependent oligopeptide transporter